MNSEHINHRNHMLVDNVSQVFFANIYELFLSLFINQRWMNTEYTPVDWMLISLVQIAFIYGICYWLIRSQFSDIQYPFNIDKHSIVFFIPLEWWRFKMSEYRIFNWVPWWWLQIDLHFIKLNLIWFKIASSVIGGFVERRFSENANFFLLHLLWHWYTFEKNSKKLDSNYCIKVSVCIEWSKTLPKF